MNEYQPDTKPDRRLVSEAFEHVRKLDLEARQGISNRNINRILGLEPSLELTQSDIYPFEYMRISEQSLCRSSIVYAHSARQNPGADHVQPYDRMGVSQDTDTDSYRLFINFLNSPDLEHGNYRVMFSANNKNSQPGDAAPNLSSERKNQALHNLLQLTHDDLFLPDKRLATDREDGLLTAAAAKSGRSILAAHNIDMNTDHDEHSVLFKYGTGMEEYRVVLRAKTAIDPENGVVRQANFNLRIIDVDKIATVNFAQKPGFNTAITFAFNDGALGNRLFRPFESLELKHLAARTLEQLAANSDKSALDVPREMQGPTQLEHVRVDEVKYLAQALNPRNY